MNALIARIHAALPPASERPAMAVGFAMLAALFWLVAWPEAWS